MLKPDSRIPRRWLFCCLVAALLAGAAPMWPVGSSHAASPDVPCRPGDGWRWTSGPLRPGAARDGQRALSALGIAAHVTARSFGEADSCGSFHPTATDFAVHVFAAGGRTPTAHNGLAGQVRAALAQVARPSLGVVELEYPDGSKEYLRPPASAADLPRPTAGSGTNASSFTKKVYVVVYDPLLSNGQLLSDYLHWVEHSDLTQGTVDLFAGTSGGAMNYEVVQTTVRTDGWPVKVDGYRYTEAEYLAAISGQGPWHSPDGVDYNKIVTDPQLDICGKANRGEIDEVWIYNGPGFGFYESTLVGPGAYWYNSPPVPGPHDCNRLIPIMGPSPERGLDCAIENFGHRTESTMTKVYGSWQQNRTSHNWEKFALVKAQSPSYNYSGCGSIHYPPNGVSDYDYGNTSTVNSTCLDFENYPNLGDPPSVWKPVTCTAWSCDHLLYFDYWYTHYPNGDGCGSDRIDASWWRYFAQPFDALDPTAGCPYPPDVSIAGRVARSDGTPVAGASVTLSGAGSGARTTGTDGRYSFSSLAPGNYTLSVSLSGYTTPPAQSVTLPPPRYDVNFVLTYPQLTFIDVDFTPTTLYAGELLKVEARLKNTGDEIAATQGPSPDFVYTEGDSFTSRGYGEEYSRWRLGVNWGPSFPYGAYWFRWGTGHPVAPGETVSVVGYMKLLTPQTQDYWAGIVREGMGWYQEGMGRTTITVLPCVLATAPAPHVEIIALDPATLKLTWGAIGNADHYDIYRSTTPNPDLSEPFDTVSTLFLEDSVLGEPGTNYYYRVKAGAGGCHGAPSNVVGRFEFELEPGR